jgi:acetylornithine deacetylase/succinyl-diaminopimelate desuccinylase-like protein
MLSVDLDGRLLPGFAPDDLLAELRPILPSDVTMEVIRHVPGPGMPDMGGFEPLARALRDADPDAIPVPLLVSASTDARHFARLGIQTYGFTPMQLPPSLPFTRLFHGVDERVPADALHFGARTIADVLRAASG